MIIFGLIGYGTIAPFYIEAIAENKTSQLIAVCDTNLQKKIVDEIYRKA